MSALEATSDLLSAALDYAARGWRVLPLHDVSRGVCSCAKGAACGSGGKHPRIKNWPEEASTDPDKIKKWWSQFPRANIGFATGGASRLVALDIDPGKGGAESLRSLADLPPTLTARTGSGGEHRIFRVDDDMDLSKLGNTASVLAPGLDLRTTGGQIVVEPSVSSAGPYRWVDVNATIAPLPFWLFKAATDEPEPETRPRPAVQIGTASIRDRARKYLAKMGGAVAGSNGHNATFKAAIALVRGFNLSTETALDLLGEFNERCKPKWSDRELRHKIDSAVKNSRVPWGYLLSEQKPRNESRENTSEAYAAMQRGSGSRDSSPDDAGRDSMPEMPADVEPNDARPEILVTLDLPRMVDEACLAISALEIYQRARRLVGVARGQFGIETQMIARGYLVELLTKCARWIKIAPLKDADMNLPDRFKVVVDGVECKRVEVAPPANVVLSLCDRTAWPHVRELDAIAEVPFARDNGALVTVDGYDSDSKCLLMEV